MATTKIKTELISDGAVTSNKLDTNISIAGDLAVDTNTLFVDSATNNLGIGTTSPATKLDVVGTYRMQFRTDDAIPELRATTANGAAFKELGLNGSQLVFNISAAERMRIDSDGNVGIGTSSPTSNGGSFAKLVHIHNPIVEGWSVSHYTNGSTGAAAGDGLIVGMVGNNATVFNYENGFLDFGANGGTKMRLETNGDLHVDGDVIAYSTTISDERLKDDIQTIDNALDKVSNLRGVSYTWNNGSRKGQKDLGLIAQEVEQVLPELVREKEMPMIDGGTYKTVDYEKIVGVLIEAVKELKTEIEILKAK